MYRKKICTDELIQLALMISLLRINQEALDECYMINSGHHYNSDNGAVRSSLTLTVYRSPYIHLKSFNTALQNYERDLIMDLNSLGHYTQGKYRYPEVHTYLLNTERTTTGSPFGTIAGLNASTQNDSYGNESEDLLPIMENPHDLELSQEDMDLIEILWKQDVDLGFSLEAAREEEQQKRKSTVTDPCKDISKTPPVPVCKSDELKEAKTEKTEDEEIDTEPCEEDIWAGVDYTIDTETGEYVIKEEPGGEATSPCNLEDLTLPLPEFILDEALRVVELDNERKKTSENLKVLDELEDNCKKIDGSPPVPNAKKKEVLDVFDLLRDMIQTPQFHHPHHRTAFQATDLTDTILRDFSCVSIWLVKVADVLPIMLLASSERSFRQRSEEANSMIDETLTSQVLTQEKSRKIVSSRMPFVRTVSMEQRWQDLANLLSLPNPSDLHPFGAHHTLSNYGPPHAHAHPAAAYDGRGVLLHNATLPAPMGDLNSSMPYGNIGGTIGNAVATSMNLTNSSEPIGESSNVPQYKLEPSSDTVYYQNNTGSEFVNNQADGFLSNLLNEDDLQLMDMAMNEGMYTMRMLESNHTVSNLSINGLAGTTGASRQDMERLDTSSDSAVSSMGSERVPSLSDGEWCDAGSDSGHTTTGETFSQDYQSKQRPFDYSYPTRLSENPRMPPVPQKKHLMYGKRFHSPGFSEYRDPSNSFHQSISREKISEIKYSCSAEFNHLPRTHIEHIQHNHSYSLPAENSGAMQRPVSRDKEKYRKSEEEHLSRDEKRARALNIPISVDDIINLPMDEFNERLSKYDLSEAQLSLIRDVRRRGKNKVAAQNCRKRKLDQILSLADEVKEMRDRKTSVMNEHKYAMMELSRMKDKYQQLYRHVFQNLRDPEGNQYSPYQFSLQTAADGSILMIPRSNNSNNNTIDREESPQNRKD